MKTIITLALVLVASSAFAQSRVSYDGCNTSVCNEFGGCAVTAVYCQPMREAAITPPLAPDQAIGSTAPPCHLVSTKGGGYTLECDAPFVEPHAKLFHAWMMAAGALQVGEKMQTAYILGQGNGRELNPVLAPFASRPAVFGAVEGAILTSSIIMATKYHASPNPTLRWAARIIVMELTVLGTWAVVNNQKHLR